MSNGNSSTNNFHYNGDTWTAPDDGIITMIASATVSGSTVFYAYFRTESDSLQAAIAVLNSTGGLTYSASCPVYKGVKYKLAIGGFSSVNVGYAQFNYT